MEYVRYLSGNGGCDCFLSRWSGGQRSSQRIHSRCYTEVSFQILHVYICIDAD